MSKPNAPFDTAKFINHHQAGGIESYTMNDGDGRGVRVLNVNTGGGLRYRVLVDRGLDIDHAFLHQHSLSFLTYKGVTAPTRALDKGLDWLKSFPGGLLTSCGPFNIGGPATDDGEEVGLHGPHSNTPATIESIVQPNPHAGEIDMTIVGRVRYGAFYGPCVELRRTITSTLGRNDIRIQDVFTNAGNTAVPHGWLLHINFGYPLCDAGSQFCYHADKVEPLPGSPEAAERFKDGVDYKTMPDVLPSHSGSTSYVGYLYPKPDRNGLATVGIVNPQLNIGVAVRYDTREFGRCVNWQHWGRYEYVTALEPSTGSVEGRDKDRAAGLLQSLKPGKTKSYTYSIEALTTPAQLDALRALNKKAR